MQTLSEELLEINQEFYDAFMSLDYAKMQKIWMKADYIKCLHPGWRITSGYQAVMESWQMIFRSTNSMHFEVHEAEAVVFGRIGMVTLCETLTSSSMQNESFSKASLAVTNLFELTDDGWKMILHQAGPTEADEQGLADGDESGDQDDLLK